MSVMRAYVGTTPTITDTIKDQDGAAVSLTGATATLYVRPDAAATPITQLVGTPDPDQTLHKGLVRRLLGNPIMASAADYETWWHVVFGDGTILETPNSGLRIETHDPAAGDGAGPCRAWIDSDDIAALPGADSYPDTDFSEYAIIASELLYQWSGRQFPGDCTRTVRPSRSSCSCWASSWYRPAWVSWDFWAGRWWRDGERRPLIDGCGPLSTVLLPGYVRAVTEVRVNGLVVDPSWYRLDFNRELVALYDDNGSAYSWPACQDMRLGDADAGAFVVTYQWGHLVPSSGKTAAARLALELWKADNGGKCQLPTAVVRLVRQGVTLERDTKKDSPIGLAAVDAFLAAYNPKRLRRAPAVWSPDLPRTPRRTA